MNKTKRRFGGGGGWAQGRDPLEILRLALDANAPDSPFRIDATPFFDRCEDGLMSLHYGGRFDLIDLFGWEVTDEYRVDMKYITWVRPEFSEGSATAGYLSDPCATPNSYEFGTSDMSFVDFGRYGRSAPVRDTHRPTKYCKTDPRYRLDGSVVTSEWEWDVAMATDVIRQDLYRDSISGNSSNEGQMDGLQRLIKTGYNSPMLDSMVFDWAGNNLDGEGGGTMTFNGNNLPSKPALVDMLLAIYRRFKQRQKWSPQLATQSRRVGDTVLAMPSFLVEALLDSYTCWSVCSGDSGDRIDMRDFRNGLMGGMFGDGRIFLDGDEIPLLGYDWETMRGDSRGDIYFLNLRIGDIPLWRGQILSGSVVASEMGNLGHSEYFTTDGGRIVGTTEVQKLCYQTMLWIRPRLLGRAPWLQARITDVEAETILDPLSPDPLSSFFPVTSFAPEKTTV